MLRLRSLSPIAVAIAAGLSFPALAHADDVQDAVVNTKCSSDQITAALQKESPVAYAYFSGDPQRFAKAEGELNSFLAKSPQARRAALSQKSENGQSLIGALEQYQDIALRVLNSCDQY